MFFWFTFFFSWWQSSMFQWSYFLLTFSRLDVIFTHFSFVSVAFFIAFWTRNTQSTSEDSSHDIILDYRIYFYNLTDLIAILLFDQYTQWTWTLIPKNHTSKTKKNMWLEHQPPSGGFFNADGLPDLTWHIIVLLCIFYALLLHRSLKSTSIPA